MNQFTKKNTVISVSQLNRQSKELLETYLHGVQVTGEISNLARPSSGHWYFTLKDQRAQVRCAMFKSRTQYLKFVPKEGDQVVVTASVSLYEARGDYQLIVNSMKSAGEGALQLAFEELKQHLFKEGLFDAQHKQTLPSQPKHIGIVTSPTGAAVKDIISVLKRRFPSLPISIYPTQVQGQQATQQIVNAIEQANRDNICDVLIIGRGGGSLEDLWPFNEEAVARAVFSSRIATISAVGHEVDTSISDFVADLRAPTPSAAAELVSPDRFEWLGRFEQLERSLTRVIQNKMRQHNQQIVQLSKRLRHPKDKLNEHMQRLDMAEMRLKNAVARRIQDNKNRLQRCQQSLAGFKPDQQLALMQRTNDQLSKRLRSAIQAKLNQSQQALARNVEVLNAVSPLSTLSRGYAINTDQHGRVIHQALQVAVGDTINAQLHQGTLRCTVDSVHEE